MIAREDLAKIGQFHKTHGIHGEIVFHFTDRSFEDSDCPFLICELNGIWVPFRMEEYRFRSDNSALVKLKNMDSAQKAKILVNQAVYFPKKQLRQEENNPYYSWEDFIGFTLIDEEKGTVGAIVDVDDSTLNTLFIVEKDGEEIYIPATAEMMTRIDEERREIYVELPEGLIE
ncbi:MAG: ribosome maturation factor RimM [Dysgonamonadaceae bacterium]|nr:ribosome maturation factor RimM [Dysgonamonadaceae bacterium]